MLSPGQTRQQPGNACDGKLSMRYLRSFDVPLTGGWRPRRMSQKEAAMRQATSSLQLLCEDAGCVSFQREACFSESPEQERLEDG